MSTSTAQLIDRSADNDTTDHDERYGEQANPANNTTYRAVSKHLKLHLLVLSTITFGCLFASFILIKKAPYGTYDGYHYEARYTTKGLGKWILTSLIISIINLTIPLHSIINLVVNITFASGIIVKLVPFFGALPTDSWCARYGYPPQYPTPGPLPAEPECLEKKRTVEIMMIVSGVFAALLAAMYIIRVVLRGIIVLQSRFWTESSWSIPTGNYTFQISLNVIRREAETGSTTSHGPVHL